MKVFVGAKYKNEYGLCWVKTIWGNGLVEVHYYKGNPPQLLSPNGPSLDGWELLNEKEHCLTQYKKYVTKLEEGIGS